MEFRILGPLEVIGERGAVELGGRKQRTLLAVLLLHPNESVSVERLAAALWGEEAPAHAVKTVRVHVSRLRKAFDGCEILSTTSAGYRLRVEPGELDAERFTGAIDAARAVFARGHPARAADMVRKALGLWRGGALADLAFEPFAQAEIARLEEERLAALELRLDADLRCARHGALLGELRQLASEHPTREGLASLRMLALYRSGRQAEALEAYRELRGVLVSEVGIEPGMDVRRLHAAILRQDPELELVSTEAELPPPLEAAAATPLVGRDAELGRLREHWERARAGAGQLVVLLGEAGIGKTRLAAAVAHDAGEDEGAVFYAVAPVSGEAITHMLDDAAGAGRTAVVIVDDADAPADSRLPGALAVLERRIRGSPVLLLVAYRDERAVPPMRWDARLRLTALSDEQSLALARSRYPAAVVGEVVPSGPLMDSHGIPGRLLERLAPWAREQAARRVSRDVGETAAERDTLQSMHARLVEDVLALQATAERDRVAADAGRAAHVVCPFKGLAAYDVADAPFFFGRERLVAELVARLVGAPLLGVVGASGSGKSSVVRAGLLAALSQDVLPGSARWGQVVIRPGEHPLRELRRALAANGSSERVVVVVDQFEELFTRCGDAREREAFTAALVGVERSRRLVVLAIRADHYGRCAAYPELSRRLAEHHVLVGAMRRDELRRAVEQPARTVGLRVEADLVDAVVADVEREPGALPTLSTALLELWQHRDGRRLTLATYDGLGGARGAVARQAERAYTALTTDERGIARATLLRLVADDGAGGVERRRVPLDVLEPEGHRAVAHVVRRLTDERLITTSAGAVELAHEALLREWPRLRSWLDEDADARRLRRHLSDSAQEWHRNGRDPTDLYRGARLAAALDWRRRHGDELTAGEAAFLDAGDFAARTELAGAQRRARRSHAVAAVLGVLAVIATGSAVLAARETERATGERALAVSRSVATEAVSELHADFASSALLALEAYRIAPTFEARSAVLSALSQFNGEERAIGHERTPIDDLAFSPRAPILVTGGDDGSVRFWNPATRRPPEGPLRTGREPVASLAFGPGGRTILIADAFQPTASLWDVATQRVLPPLIRTGVSGHTPRVAMSPDGRTIAIGYELSGLRLWDARTRRPLETLLRRSNPGPVTPEQIDSLAFSPDGRTLASGGNDDQLRLWHMNARPPVARHLVGSLADIDSVAFSADGRMLASGSYDHVIRLWDVRTGREIGEPLTGHGGPVESVAFSTDGRTLASAGDDGTIRLWDIAARRELGQPLRAGNGAVRSLAFSPDGRTLASGGDDGTVRLWSRTLWSDDRQAVGARICAAVRGPLTREQWATFLPGEPYHLTCTAAGTLG